MRLIDYTANDPAENLALDEALLDEAEAGSDDSLPMETLRLWMPRTPFVVLGNSSRIAEEVDLDACRELEIPVLRRASGGAAIVTGPGCLMYSLILSLDARPFLRDIAAAHCHVLSKCRDAISHLAGPIEIRGTSDLTLDGRKFSGNSLRIKRSWLVYHGTLLFDFDLSLIERCLKLPPRRPDYRGSRSHIEFVANLPIELSPLKSALVATWGAEPVDLQLPDSRVRKLLADRYANRSWIRRR